MLHRRLNRWNHAARGGTLAVVAGLAMGLALAGGGCSSQSAGGSGAALTGGTRLTVGQGEYRVPESDAAPGAPYALTGTEGPSAGPRADAWTASDHPQMTVGQAQIFIPAQR